MKKTLMLSVLITFVSFSIVLAQESKMFEFNFEVYKNDTVILNGFSVIEGRETGYLPLGNYSLKILNSDDNVLWERSFDIQFILFTEPPEFLENVPIVLTIPYNEDAFKVIFYHNTKILYDEKILELLCNKNDICESFENYLSCPDDCASGSKDNYCDKILDGVCDPDCAEEVDIDCTCGNNICDERESKKTCPDDCNILSPFIPIGIIIVIIVVGLVLFKVKK